MPSMKHDYQLQRFDKLDSTNDWLKRNYASQMDGSVILAKQQTKGRGRFERTWESNEDLTFSILYKQAFPYPIIFPLALVKALESFGMQAMIKWPNDILLNGKKVCGILIETVYEGSQKAAMIVGIGINVTQKKGELADKAGYVAVDKEELLQVVLTQCERCRQLPLETLLQTYQNYHVLKGRKIWLDHVLWEVKEVTSEGGLRICTAQTTRILCSEEISLSNIYKERNL